MKIPSYLKKYFWDTDFSKLDLQKNRSYILSRIFEYGDTNAVKWAFRNFPEQDIIKIVRESRTLSPKSGNFWALFFNINKTTLRCFQKSFLQLQSSHWAS